MSILLHPEEGSVIIQAKTVVECVVELLNLPSRKQKAKATDLVKNATDRLQMEEFKKKICRVLAIDDIPESVYASKYICAYDLRKKWQRINHPQHLVGMLSEIDATAFANVTMEVLNEPFPTPTEVVSNKMDELRLWYT